MNSGSKVGWDASIGRADNTRRAWLGRALRYWAEVARGSMPQALAWLGSNEHRLRSRVVKYASIARNLGADRVTFALAARNRSRRGVTRGRADRRSAARPTGCSENNAGRVSFKLPIPANPGQFQTAVDRPGRGTGFQAEQGTG